MKHVLITIAVVLLVGCAHGTVPRKAITSDDAPAALGPYSPGVQVGEFLFLSGQIGLNPETGKRVEGGQTCGGPGKRVEDGFDFKLKRCNTKAATIAGCRKSVTLSLPPQK